MKYQFYVDAEGKAEPAGTSNVPLVRDGVETVEIDVTETQLAKIDARYDVSITNGKATFSKGSAALELEAEQSETRKAEIVSRLGELKTQLDGLSILGEPTEALDAEILSLKEEYASLN